jgi:hypothetical protein
MARNTVEPQRQGARVDIVGSGLFILAMLLLTVGITQGSQWGWASPGVLVLFAGAIAALAAFTATEKHRTHPMLDLSVLTNRRFVALCLVPVAGSFGFVTMLTYLPSYLTAAGGYTGGTAGLIMILLTAPMLVLPLLAAKLVSRGISALGIISVSLVCLIVGDAALTLFHPDVSITVVALPMIVTGAGYALAAGLVDGQALALVNPERAGMAAGFLNTMRLGSEAIAVALYGSLLATTLTAKVRDGISAFPETSDPAQAAGQAAGGDVTGPASSVAAPLRAQFTGFLISAYDSAFHTVLWVLAGLCTDRGKPLSWVQIGSVAGPTAEIPSAALRAARLQIVGNGQGSVPTRDILAELPQIAEAIASGSFTIDTEAVPLAEVEQAWGRAYGSNRRIVITPQA